MKDVFTGVPRAGRSSAGHTRARVRTRPLPSGTPAVCAGDTLAFVNRRRRQQPRTAA